MNLTTRQEVQITTDPSRQWLPRISGDQVVWIDERNGNWDMYGHNLSYQKEYQVSSGQDNEAWPDISNGTVVYVEYVKRTQLNLMVIKMPDVVR